MRASPMLPQLHLQFPNHDFAVAYALAGPNLAADSRPCPCSGSALCSSPDVNCYGFQDSNCSSLGGKHVPSVVGDAATARLSWRHFAAGQLLAIPEGATVRTCRAGTMTRDICRKQPAHVCSHDGLYSARNLPNREFVGQISEKNEVLMPMATLSSFVLPGPMSEAARCGLAL